MNYDQNEVDLMSHLGVLEHEGNVPLSTLLGEDKHEALVGSGTGLY